MFRARKKTLNSKPNRITAPKYLEQYIGLDKTHDVFTRAAKEYAVNSCVANMESLRYGIENHLISAEPYKMSELYEQAICAEKAFTAGAQWAFQNLNSIEKQK
jgi:hypothetical protein